MNRRRWHVCKVGPGWLAHPRDGDVHDASHWTFWEDALAHAITMAGVDLIEATA